MTPLIASSGHVPFYVAAGALAVWAIVIGAVGIRSTNFPSSDGLTKALSAITVVLVVGTIGLAISTGETPEEIEPQRPEISLGVIPQPNTPESEFAGGPTPPAEGGSEAP